MSIGKFLCKINWTWGKWYLFHHVLHNIELSGMYFVFPWLIYMWCMCWITFIMSFKIVLVRNTHSVWCWTNCTVMKISAGKILRTPSWHGYIPSLKKLETQKKKSWIITPHFLSKYCLNCGFLTILNGKCAT